MTAKFLTKRITLLILISFFVCFAYDLAWSEWQIEYSSTIIRQTGGPSRRGNFATKQQCESTRESSARTTGNYSYLMRNSQCVGYDTPSKSRPPYSTPGITSDDDQTQQDAENRRRRQEEEEAKQRELEREKEFERGKVDLMGTLKGGGAGTLGLKTSPTQGLALKGSPETGSTGLKTPGMLDNEKDLEKVRARISELQVKIKTLQLHLGRFSKSLLANNSELEGWAKTVDDASNNALETGKEYLPSLFIQYNLLGVLGRSVQKGIFTRLDNLINSTDPEVRLWLGKEIKRRHVELERVKKGVDVGMLSGDFAGLLTSNDEEWRKNLDALLFVNDLIEGVGLSKAELSQMGAGQYFQQARMTGEALGDASSVLTGWFQINKLTRQNEQYAQEVESYSNRMKSVNIELQCLKGCLEKYDDRCMDRCMGKTRLSTPPPLPK